MDPPVLLFFFANAPPGDRRHLRALTPELQALRALEGALRAHGVEPMYEADATREHVLDRLGDPRLRRRIISVHFSGHADHDRWLLAGAHDTAPARADGLIPRLTALPALTLVVLNGCHTRDQTDRLRAAGVPAVIGTDAAVADAAAATLAAHLYRALARGDTIGAAYRAALDAVRTAPDAAWSSARMLAPADDGPPDALPWSFAHDPDAERWTLAAAIGDPLLGLPPPPPGPLPATPYRHVERFTARDARIFFGRRAEIRRAFDLLTDPAAPRLLLMYGDSGVGKSSLLGAGVAPRLTAADRAAQVRRIGRDAPLDVLTAALGGDPTASATWQRADAADRPPIVVLDQLEDAIVTRDGHLDALDTLAAALAAAWAHTDPLGAARLVLSFRKDYLAEVRGALDRAGLTAWSTLYLRPLDRAAVVEVVEGLARDPALRAFYQVELEPGLADRVAAELTANRPAAVAPVLQIVLTRMWETDATPPVRFDARRYTDALRSGAGLGQIFADQLAAAEARAGGVAADGLLLDLLEAHTTAQGTAGALTAAERAHRYPAPERAVSACVEHRLLARDPATGTTALAHDVWAPWVDAGFRASDRPGQRARRIIENRTPDLSDQPTLALDTHDLRLVERGLAAMRRLTDVEQRLLDNSREAARRRRRHRRVLIGIAGVVATALTIGAAVIIEQRADLSATNTRLSVAVAVAEAARSDTEKQRAEAQRSADRLADTIWMRMASDHADDPTIAAAALRHVRHPEDFDLWLQATIDALNQPVARSWLHGHLLGMSDTGLLTVRRGAAIVRADPILGVETPLAAPVVLGDLRGMATDHEGRPLTLTVQTDRSNDRLTFHVSDFRGDALAEIPDCADSLYRTSSSWSLPGEPTWAFAVICGDVPALIDRRGRVRALAKLAGFTELSLVAVASDRPAMLLADSWVRYPDEDAHVGFQRAIREHRGCTPFWVESTDTRELPWSNEDCPRFPPPGVEATGHLVSSEGAEAWVHSGRWHSELTFTEGAARPLWLGADRAISASRHPESGVRFQTYGDAVRIWPAQQPPVRFMTRLAVPWRVLASNASGRAYAIDEHGQILRLSVSDGWTQPLPDAPSPDRRSRWHLAVEWGDAATESRLLVHEAQSDRLWVLDGKTGQTVHEWFLDDIVCDAIWGGMADRVVTLDSSGRMQVWWLGAREPFALRSWDLEMPFTAIASQGWLDRRSRCIEGKLGWQFTFADYFGEDGGTNWHIDSLDDLFGDPHEPRVVADSTSRAVSVNGLLLPLAQPQRRKGESLSRRPLLAASPDGRWLLVHDHATKDLYRWPVTIDSARELLAEAVESCVPPSRLTRPEYFALDDDAALDAYTRCEAGRRAERAAKRPAQ